MHGASHEQADFPFPALATLNRARLQHLLDWQIRTSSSKDAQGNPVDGNSAAHFKALQSAIRTLNGTGAPFSPSFSAIATISDAMLAGVRSAVASDKANARLTPLHLLDVLTTLCSSPSPNLAHPSELPPALLDAGIMYRPDEERAVNLQLSPYVYHRALCLVALLLNLHLHQLVLARVLSLLPAIEPHLQWWLAHQAIPSLPKPYRLWQFLKFKLSGSIGSKLHPSASSASFGGLHSPRKLARSTSIPNGISASAAAAASQNPYTRWDRIAARNVRELLALKKKWTTRCGRLAVRMHRLQEILIASFSRSASGPHTSAPPAFVFHQHMAASDAYFAALFRYVTREDVADQLGAEDEASLGSGAKVHYSASHGRGSAARSSMGPGIEAKVLAQLRQFGLFERCLVSFESDFTTSFDEAVHACRKPHWLFERWHYLTAVSLVAGAGAVYALRNQEATRAAVSGAYSSARFFLHEHLWEPLGNIVDTTRKTFHDRALFSTNANTLQQSKRNLSAMLSEFASSHVKELAANEELARDDYKERIALRAAAGDMDLVMKTYERELQRPILSLLFGDLMRGLLIQVQKVKVDTEAAMLAMDQILRANTVNFNILATIPFALLAFGLADFTNRYIARGTWGSQLVRANARQACRLLCELEQVYILHLPQMAPNVSAATGTSAASRGDRRSQLSHARFLTMSVDDFASLSAQDQEDEDHALRLLSPQPEDSSGWSDRHSRLLGSDLFGRASEIAAAAEQAEGDSEDDETGLAHECPPAAAISHERRPLSRTLFSSAGSASSSMPASLFLPSAPSVLGLSDHAYGHTLLLLHELSAKFAALPLTSSFTPRQLSSRPTGANDPRVVLRKDLLLLASHTLTPKQKMLWLQNMRHLNEFLRHAS